MQLTQDLWWCIAEFLDARSTVLIVSTCSTLHQWLRHFPLVHVSSLKYSTWKASEKFWRTRIAYLSNVPNSALNSTTLQKLCILNSFVLSELTVFEEFLPSLTRLEIIFCCNLKAVVIHHNKLNYLSVCRCHMLTSVASTAHRLKEAHFVRCDALAEVGNVASVVTLRFLECASFVSCAGLDEAESITHLHLSRCYSLVHWGGLVLRYLVCLNVSFSSLTSLNGIEECPLLETLDVRGCTRLRYLPADLGRNNCALRNFQADYSALCSLSALEYATRLETISARECVFLNDVRSLETCTRLLALYLHRSPDIARVNHVALRTLEWTNVAPDELGESTAVELHVLLQRCPALIHCRVQYNSRVTCKEDVSHACVEEIDVRGCKYFSPRSWVLQIPKLKTLRISEGLVSGCLSTTGTPLLHTLQADSCPYLESVEVTHVNSLRYLSARFCASLRSVSKVEEPRCYYSVFGSLFVID